MLECDCFGSIMTIVPCFDGGCTCSSGIEQVLSGSGDTLRMIVVGKRVPARRWNFCLLKSLTKSCFAPSSDWAAREQATVSSIEILRMRL